MTSSHCYLQLPTRSICPRCKSFFIYLSEMLIIFTRCPISNQCLPDTMSPFCISATSSRIYCAWSTPSPGYFPCARTKDCLNSSSPPFSQFLAKVSQPPGVLTESLQPENNITFLDAVGRQPRVLPYEYFRGFKVRNQCQIVPSWILLLESWIFGAYQ